MPRGGARSRSGPPPTPTNLLTLRGSRRGKRRKAEPKPKTAGLEPPKWLDREGKVVWREYALKLHELELLTELDVEMFAQACSLAAVARRLLPGSADRLKAVGAMSSILARFGFTPSDRTKIAVAPKLKDPFEEFLGKKAK